MNRDERTAALAARLTETAHAHHEAYRDTDGEDPDWPVWYATLLRDPLARDFGIDRTKTQLIVCLVALDQEHRARAADAPWAPYYAARLMDRFRSEPDETLALYFYPACPYCQRVVRAIDRLGIDVERRDIRQHDEHRDALLEARGRLTVPVLRCTTPQSDRWMPESSDIIAFLESTAA